MVTLVVAATMLVVSGRAQLADTGVRIPDGRRIDSLLTTLEVSKQFSGAVAILDHGTAVYRRTVGVVAAGGPNASMQTRYRADVALPIVVSIVALQAAERGLVERSASIAQWFPGLRGAQAITIDHLIRQESGLAVIDGMTPPEVWKRTGTTDSLIAYLNEVGPVCQPGVCRSWSTTECRLLIAVLEQVTGEPIGTAAARLFRDLGMWATTVAGQRRPSETRDAAPVRRVDSVWTNVDVASVPDEPWHVYTTAHDASLLLRALYRPSKLSEAVAATMRGLMTTSIPASAPTVSIFGSGVSVHARNGGGGAMFVWYDRADLAIVILTNGAEVDEEAVRDAVLGMIPRK